MLRRPARNRVPGDPPPAPAADDDLGHDDIHVALGRAQGVVDAAMCSAASPPDRAFGKSIRELNRMAG